MNGSMQRIAMALVLAGLMVGCIPVDTPNQPTQALAPAPVGAPGPTRVYDVPPPPTQQQPTVAVPPTAEPTAEVAAEPTDAPVTQNPPASPKAETTVWDGKMTILHTNDSVGYLDPCG
jgi:hypothetical protein